MHCIGQTKMHYVGSSYEIALHNESYLLYGTKTVDNTISSKMIHYTL